MGTTPSTRWTLIRKAAEGLEPDREDFARLYEPVVRAYLRARWAKTPLIQETDDAVQEVFFACFKTEGALSRAEQGRPGGFRAYLFGVIRKVALHLERTMSRRRDRPGAASFDASAHAADDEPLSTIFDRAWATAILREAADRQAERALGKGANVERRVELLRLRFNDGLPIRDIAQQWGVDAAWLHHQYAKARDDYRAALREVVAYHHPGSEEEVEAECSRLLDCFG